jgi:tetratricopeptide (TPR) repeat protein
MGWRRACAVLCLLPFATAAQQLSSAPHQVAIAEAYDAAYNLDHEQALIAVRRAVALAPDQSASHRALAGILWMQIVFARGAVSIDHYMNGVTSGRLALPKPPPGLDAEFKSAIARAITLAEAGLARNKKDPAALYDMGRAYALQASYIASVDGAGMAAFRAASRAYDAEEEVLEREPNHAGATFVVGTYRYIVSALSLPTRWLAYVVGFGGGKERGIQMIETSAKDASIRIDALTALMLIYTREGRHADVMRLARELARDYPRNRLYALEEGAAAIRAGRASEAEDVLTRGLAIFERDARPKVPGERAFWLYKRGVARLLQRKLPEAGADLVAALDAAPPGWLRGRIHLEIGKIHDLEARRPNALADYRLAKSLCETNNDPGCITSANRWIGRVYGK